MTLVALVSASAQFLVRLFAILLNHSPSLIRLSGSLPFPAVTPRPLVLSVSVAALALLALGSGVNKSG